MISETVSTLPPLSTFWLGPSLGLVERACLRSALRQGHPVTLYSYGVPAGIPEGVEVRDAAAIVPEDRIILHDNGSPALFSNLFRYELQRRGAGTWIDADLYLLRPIESDAPHLFGWESPHTINTAVLRIPAESPLLRSLLAIFEERQVPPWLPLRYRWAARFRKWRTGRTGLSQMPWGTAGPKALTALLKERGLTSAALPPSIFYPVPWQEAAWIRDPRNRLEDRIGPDTIAVHLWNEHIRAWKELPAPSGTFLERLQREGA